MSAHAPCFWRCRFTSVSTPDDDLTIALAEYAHLNELRHQLEQKSSNRFNFFLALSTASAAVSAALLSQIKGSVVVNIAVGALMGMVLVIGSTTFLRQLRFTRQNARLDAAQIAVRTYLAHRAPAVRPYMFLPVGDDRGVLPRGKSNWVNQSLGLAGTTAIINSALLALAVVFALGPDLLPIIAFILALIGQIAYVGKARARWSHEIRLLNEARGIHPSAPA
jgi:hypothetical protein